MPQRLTQDLKNTIRVCLRVCLMAAALVMIASAVQAAWVRDTVLTVRSDPGKGERTNLVRSGDPVTVLQKNERFTKIRLSDGTEGWITSGFLRAEPPPIVSLETHEAMVTDLQTRLDSALERNGQLEEQSSVLSGRDGTQRSEIDRLTMENMELRAGARWPEWITGASVLAAGMLLGAAILASAKRRPSSRIRL